MQTCHTQAGMNWKDRSGLIARQRGRFGIQYAWSNQIKSNQTKSYQIKSNQIKSNQIKSTQINWHVVAGRAMQGNGAM